MYCVIQEIELKKSNKHGYPKELISEFMQMSVMGQDCSHYWHYYSEERFDRPIKKAYKISIHISYREDGKVKKKQYPLCTVNYYDIADGWFSPYEYCYSKITTLSNVLNICEDEIYNLVNAKLEPLTESIRNEFSKTVEFKVYTEHERITTLYAANKVKFNEKYQCDKYDQIYDVFGKLMDKDKLEQIKAEYEARKEYEEKSSSYQREYYSNYNKYNSDSNKSSYSNNIQSNHNIENKETLKQFYRILSKKFHPDANPDTDTSKQMQLLNELKNQWGV